jgi:hypothetical protein
MIHALRLCALVMSSLFLLVGCGEDQDPERARALWSTIQGYQEWDAAPGYEERVPSRAPHGDEVVIYVNDAVFDTLASVARVDTWPTGSIIVKDGFDDGDLFVVAVMEKGDDGAWFWAEYDDEGDTLYSGAPEICTGCHQIGDDFVRGFFLPSDP